MAKGKKEQEIIDQMEKRLKLAVDADSHNREAGIDDLKFANGDQWDSREKKRRSDKGRPALQINLLPKFIDQVVGDMLHNTPSIKIKPVDSRGDVNIAKIRQGLIAQIEYNSNSKGIYSYAAKQQVTSGFGAWRVLTRYAEENPFIQEIYLESIRNPFLVYLDPSAKDQNYADAKWGIIVDKMLQSEFEEKYPNAALPSNEVKYGRGLSNEMWYDKEAVTLVEYFTKEEEDVEMVQLEDGRVLTDEEYKDLKKDWTEKQEKILGKIEAGPDLTAPPIGGMPPPPMGATHPGAPGVSPQPLMGSPSMPGGLKPGMPPMGGAGPKPPIPGAPPQMGQAPGAPPAPPIPQGPPPPPPIALQIKELGPEPKVAKRRSTKKPVIRHRIMTNLEILEGGKDGDRVAGKFIPIVLLKGKELNIEGKNYVYSLIRHAKDPQKLVNYWNTSAAETIALAPKAPWLGTAKQFEGYENDYAAANVENFPMLKYNVDPEAQGPPQRQQPGQPPVAMFEQIRRGEENLKSVMGMFNADVGAPGSEQTGAAITARQKPGDVATFEFSENLARAVAFTGRIINEMIPEIYDTERDARIKHIDESESFVPVNTTVGSAYNAVEKDPDRYLGLDLTKLRTLFMKEGKDAKFNDITAGKYDVIAVAGPSYTTAREESSRHLLQLVQAMPQQMAIAADLLVQNLDFKDAEELSARLRKPLIAQGIVKPRPGDPPPQPPPPNPQVLLAQAKLQGEQIKGQLAQLKVQQETVKLEHEKVKIQLEMAKAKSQGPEQPQGPDPVDQIEMQMKQMELQHSAKMKEMEAQATNLRTQLEQSRMQHELQKQQLQIQQQREAHAAKMSEMAAEIERDELKAKRESKVKKDPLRIRK